MLIPHTVQHVGAIFNQEEIVPVAERTKLHNVTRKAKVVDRQHGPGIVTDFRLEILPIRRAISSNRVEFNCCTEVVDWFYSRLAKIRGNQDFLPGPNPQGAQTMINGVASPKEIEARRRCRPPRTGSKRQRSRRKERILWDQRPGLALRGMPVQSSLRNAEKAWRIGIRFVKFLVNRARRSRKPVWR
jgi:hypothetical protein